MFKAANEQYRSLSCVVTAKIAGNNLTIRAWDATNREGRKSMTLHQQLREMEKAWAETLAKAFDRDFGVVTYQRDSSFS